MEEEVPVRRGGQADTVAIALVAATIAILGGVWLGVALLNIGGTCGHDGGLTGATYERLCESDGTFWDLAFNVPFFAWLVGTGLSLGRRSWIPLLAALAVAVPLLIALAFHPAFELEG